MSPERIQMKVIEYLTEHHESYGRSLEQIASEVAHYIQDPEVKKKRVMGVLKDMGRSGAINIGSKSKNEIITPATNFIEGTLYTKEGSIIPSGKTNRIKVPYFMCKMLDADTYTVRYIVTPDHKIVFTAISRNKEKTRAGVPVNENSLIKGCVKRNELDTAYQFYADDTKKYPKPFLVLGTPQKGLEDKIILAKLNETDLNKSTVFIESVQGEMSDPIAETNAIAIEAGISLTPNPYAKAQTDSIPTSVNTEEYNLTDENGNYLNGHNLNKVDYVDLRNKQFRTIDPFDCRDMDDSVYTELDEDGNFVTYSAIADVTEYIKPNTELWNLALKQGFTLYTPYYAYPMLPKELSHGILSLNEGEDRLTLCCKTVIDKNTGMRIPEKTKIMHAVINSKHKHSYQDVQETLNNTDISKVMADITARIKKGENVEPQTDVEVLVLNKVCSDLIWKNFKSRNVLNISRNDEKRFILDETGTRVLDIERKTHIPSMSLIEALMINTNEAVAEYTRDNNLSSVYRVHDTANVEKLEKLREMMRILEVDFNGNESNASLQKLINDNLNSEYAETIKEMVLRTQSKAKYSNNPYPTDVHGNDKPDNKCHSALQSDCYTHFTSGIRRMSDLIVQYAIKEHLRGHEQPFSEEYVANVAALVSSLELKIEEAEKKIDDMYTAIWAEEHINDVLNVKITGFNGDFVVVEEPERGIRLNVKVSDVSPKGHVDEFGVAIYDEKGEVVNKLCDRLTVKISRADRLMRFVEASTDLTKTYKSEVEQTSTVKTTKGKKGSQTVKEQLEKIKTETQEGLVATFEAWKSGQQPKKVAPATTQQVPSQSVQPSQPQNKPSGSDMGKK